MKEKDINALQSLIEVHKNAGIKNIKIVIPQGKELNINDSQTSDEHVIATAKYLKERIEGQKKALEKISNSNLKF